MRNNKGYNIDLAGKKINWLNVVSYGGRIKRGNQYVTVWNCVCDCGKEVVVPSGVLTSGTRKSCGCYKKKKPSHILYKNNNRRIRNTYDNMRKRFLNPNNPKYKTYGARGITICDEWLGKDGYRNFLNWALSNGYSDELTIERLDVNGNYEPSNCAWISKQQQAYNKTNTIWVEIDGVNKPLQIWCDEIGINNRTVKSRVKDQGMTYQEALFKPVVAHRRKVKK